MHKFLSRGAQALTLVAVVSMVAGCGLPRTGPNKREIFAGSVLEQGDAFVVTVNSRVTRAAGVTPAFGFGSDFRDAGVVGSDTINAGDTLVLTVFENVRDDPLLGNTGQRVSLLDQVQIKNIIKKKHYLVKKTSRRKLRIHFKVTDSSAIK